MGREQLPEMVSAARLAIVAIALFLPSVAHAQWDIVSDRRELVGKRIVETGSLSARTERVRRFDSSGAPTFGRDSTWLEYRGTTTRCIDDRLLSTSGRLETAALLLSDERGVIYLATFVAGINEIRVSVTVPRWITCPTDSELRQ